MNEPDHLDTTLAITGCILLVALAIFVVFVLALVIVTG